MLKDKLKDYNIILVSKSPRRKYLLKELGIDFEIWTNNNIDESYPKILKKEGIAKYLANLKASSYEAIDDKTILIAADTIVWLDNAILNKPLDKNDAISILKQLSGRDHLVITGVCIRSLNKSVVFSSTTRVFFKQLTDTEILYYVDNYKPYDKAGSYGIQEWIGYIGIPRIEGSYFNVMGLPVQKLYEELIRFHINN
jgi:septum formation protein